MVIDKNAFLTVFGKHSGVIIIKSCSVTNHETYLRCPSFNSVTFVDAGVHLLLSL